MIPRRFFWLFDLLVVSTAFLLAYPLAPRLRLLFVPGGALRVSWLEVLSLPPTEWLSQYPPLLNFAWIFVVMAPTTLLVLAMLGNHSPLLRQSRTRVLAGSIIAPLAGLSLVTLMLFAVKGEHWSRLFIFSFTLLSTVGLALYRLLLRQYFLFRQSAGFYAKNVLLIGLPAAIERMARYFDKNVPTTLYRLMGYLRICPDRLSSASPQSVAGLALMGDVDELGDLLVHHPIHEVIAIYPVSGGEWLQSVIKACDYFRVALHIVPEAMLSGELKDLQIIYRSDPLRLPAVALMPPHWDSDTLFFKRLFDVAVSATLLVLLMPLFALIAIVIKITTPHLPVLYPWRVVGQNGKPFTGYKFTTMVADADARKAELMPLNEMTGPVFKIKNDPRVTPLGCFLRKYSLNELPQLWSVLRGDMSLVGPRPAGPHELERYEFWHKRKLSIRPGITCLWQVRGRNKISNFDDWVEMDLEYIDNWSLWLDFKILVWTVWAVIAGTGS